MQQERHSMEFDDKARANFRFWFGRSISETEAVTGEKVAVADHQFQEEEKASYEALRLYHRRQLHVVFVVDTTGSMSPYIEALQTSLTQINALAQLLFPEGTADISVFSYKDYSEKPVIQKVVQGDYTRLSKFCSGLNANGGLDVAEAVKTALNSVYQQVHKWQDNHTLVFLYTDAPPHHIKTNLFGSNRLKEKKVLANKTPGFDWVHIAQAFRSMQDTVKVYTIAPRDSEANGCGAAFYALLGDLIVLPELSAKHVTEITMKILLRAIGQCANKEDESEEEHDKKGHMMATGGARKRTFANEAAILAKLNDMNVTWDEEKFAELNTNACVERSRAPFNNEGAPYRLKAPEFAAIPEIFRDLDVLQTRFKADKDYQETAFAVMKTLVTPENVMALTTNEVFSRLWRLVCTRRDDPRLTRLVSKMGECAGSKELTTNERGRLRNWIESSYNYAEEINEAILAKTTGCRKFYVMDVFGPGQVPSANGLRSLARSPSPPALKQVQAILSHMMVVETNDVDTLPVDDEGNRLYLPTSFDDYEIFTMLPHLIMPGTKFSLKPAAVLAMVCAKNNGSLLDARARVFLQSICGKWLPPVNRIDRAEIISYEFSALMASCTEDGALTTVERTFFDRLHHLWRYRRGRLHEFNVTTCLTPNKERKIPDFKQPCKECMLPTSFTLMTASGVCGVCMWKRESSLNHWNRPKENEAFYVNDNESYMVECTKCTAIYAVLGPMDLGVPPKCHYCRSKDRSLRRKGAPFSRCGVCTAKWCHPALRENDETGLFSCPICTVRTAKDAGVVPKEAISTHQVALKDIVSENREAVLAFSFRKRAVDVITEGNFRMYKAIVRNHDALFLPPVATFESADMKYNSKKILNAPDLLVDITATISHCSFTKSCQLCYDEFPVEKLHQACGGGCGNRCCQSCLESWYGENKPGALFLPSHDMCPFCRQRPRYAVLSRFNKDACGIVGASRRHGKALALSAKEYYGWCSKCWKIAYAMDRTCAQDGLPVLDGFTCEDCSVSQIDAKKCPGCDALTEHAGGCSHMTCAVCRTHWCWQCATFQAKGSGPVYQHLLAVHGGIFHNDDYHDDFYDQAV